MSEPRLISPLLDNFDMGEAISERNGVRCCPALEKDSENKYIVKIISCPASQSMLDAMIISGAYPDVQSATAYFKGLADDVVKEAEILHKLSQLEGFLPYDNWQLVPMDNESGYDIYLLSKYRKTLAHHLRNSAMTHLDAINLGLDLCASLAVCRRLGYLYTDLKPENIYLNNDYAYRIGDIGFVRLDSLKYVSLQDRYRSAYTAPEIADPFSSLNTTVDIYALGLILYQVFNGGQLPVLTDFTEGHLPAPDYADYEMAEIILKACALDPASRWQDPVEMGQAIVSYMQRNGAHNTPITPVATTTEDTNDSTEELEDNDAAPDGSLSNDVTENAGAVAEDELDDDANNIIPESETLHSNGANADGLEANVVANSDIDKVDLSEIGAFIGDNEQDETLPESNLDEIDYEDVSEEVSDILIQADDLLAHPVPDPVVTPQPVEVLLPDPFEQDEFPEESEQAVSTTSELSEDSSINSEDAITSLSTASNDESLAEPLEAQNDIDEDHISETPDVDSCEHIHEDPHDISIKVERRPKKPFNWLACVIAGLIILFLSILAYVFYTLYYLQPINTFSVQDNTNGNITVLVGSDIPDGKLYVVCTDNIYGSQVVQDIVDGRTQFTGLKPDSTYSLKLGVRGFHRLTGETELTVSTPPLTDIVQLTAVTGPEDGSVILSFTVEGPDSEQWELSYAAAGESTQTVSFTGHSYSVYGLTLGLEYTFTLIPTSVDEFTGVNTIAHTASNVIKPVNLQITGCMDNKLSASWEAPDGIAVESWNVRCYNDIGFDVTQIVTGTSAVFDGVDSSTGYFVEVTAAGMSVSEHSSIAANSITAYDIQVDDSDPKELSISWKSSTVPQGGWMFKYIVDGSKEQSISVTDGNTAVISAPVPGSTYTFTLLTGDSTPVLGGCITYSTAAAEPFSGYGLTAKNLAFSMCKTPKNKNWDRYDLSKSDYTDTFRPGTKASFLVKSNHKYKVSTDKVITLFVIRDDSGTIVSHNSTTAVWKNMLYNNYCELDIPSLPDDSGKYTITVYFNGAEVYQQKFTISN